MSISRIYGADLNGMSAFMGVEFAATGSGGPTPPEPGGVRGIFGGGNNDTNNYDIIDYIIITNPGNATDFGNLIDLTVYLGGVSNSTNGRGVFGGGNNGDPQALIQYITIATAGNADVFGNLYSYEGYNQTQNVYSCSNGTNERGVFAGGVDYYHGGFWSKIQYITISTTGDASDFGSMLADSQNTAGGTSNQTGERGLFMGGYNESEADTNVISFITINSTGNATNFGDLLGATYGGAACSNNTRAVHGGGWDSDAEDLTILQYVTIMSAGNATDFGDLIEGNDYLAATDNATGGVGIFGGGYTPYSDTIQKITIGTLGNATDFGNLTQARRGLASFSDG